MFWKLFGIFSTFGITSTWITYWLSGHDLVRGPDMILPCILTVGVLIASYLVAGDMIFSEYLEDDME